MKYCIVLFYCLFSYLVFYFVFCYVLLRLCYIVQRSFFLCQGLMCVQMYTEEKSQKDHVVTASKPSKPPLT